MWLFDYERRILWSRRRRWLIVLLLAFLALLLMDGWLYRTVAVAPMPVRPSLETVAAMREYNTRVSEVAERVRELETKDGKDFYRTFRVAGTLWPWLLICSALLAHAVTARPRPVGLAGAAIAILLSAALSGLAAEVLRILAGRLRPGAVEPPGTHQFRGLIDRFRYTDNLAFPSSHAAVAFGAAFMVAFVYPRAGAVALLAAVGCGLTRMLAGAHFASDVFAGAVLGYAIARLLRPGGWRGLDRTPLLP